MNFSKILEFWQNLESSYLPDRCLVVLSLLVVVAVPVLYAVFQKAKFRKLGMAISFLMGAAFVTGLTGCLMGWFLSWLVSSVAPGQYIKACSFLGAVVGVLFAIAREVSPRLPKEDG